MITFWVVAAALSAAAAAFVLRRAARAVASSGGEDPALALFRRQVQEIDELAERGLIAEGERKAARDEAGRRLLAADAGRAEAWAPGAERKGVLVAAVLGPLAATVLYLAVGSPAAPDQPFAARLDQWRRTDPSKLGPERLTALLRAIVAKNPKDPQALAYLAMSASASGDLSEAARAYRRAIELAPDRVELWEGLSENLMLQADGQVTPEAMSALRETLKRDPNSVMAHFHVARARIEAGEREAGIAEWRALLAGLPADDPRRETLVKAIDEAEHPKAEAPQPGLDQGQLAAVRGMVAGLAARLERDPDDAEGWVRLVRSYAVLGEASARDAALAKARARFANQPQILQELDAAAATPAMGGQASAPKVQP